MFIARHIKNQLVARWQASRSVYLFGPRQSGKTTLARHVLPDVPYVSLEDPDQLDYVQTDPRGFLAQFPQNAIIDEPQRAPQLFSYLQGQIDHEHKKFLLTSSQNFLTMSSISQSLAGRITILNLLPLSRREISHLPLPDLTRFFSVKKNTSQPISELWHDILYGGYPEIHQTPEVRSYWHSDYVKTYLERDVRQIIHVQDLSVFQRFIKLCAARTGCILNKASLASDCGISETNCTRWLSLLEQSGLVMYLKPYANNFNKRQTKSPKLFFIDTGLCCYLLGIKKPEHLMHHPLMGSIVETYVVSELYKNMINHGVEPNLYFWRDQSGHEIDLIMETEGGDVIPIEIKAGQTLAQSMFKPLQKWCELAEVSKGILLYGGVQHQERQQITALPISSVV